MSLQQSETVTVVEQAPTVEAPGASEAVDVPQTGDGQTHEGVQRLMTYGPGTRQFAQFMSR